MGRKTQSPVLKTDGNGHSRMAKLEFQRTQNPTLHAPIPIWGLYARVAEHHRICLDWEKSEIRRGEGGEIGWGGTKSGCSVLWSLRQMVGEKEQFWDKWNTDECPALSRSFTALPKWDFWNTGRKKPIVKVENLSNLEQMIRNGGIKKNLKSKTQSIDSNLRPRCEGSGKTAFNGTTRRDWKSPTWGRRVWVTGIVRL
ncbi:hypothetical protein AVEN_166717-1 [Araneus ventricosus]|uniref:Uncharacterized protein n=1 Tax=Araneus ventricosus TaxID=182803 RepID=A0A4Y2X8L3_ARAVE|nr:hypothetical protein AVEN_166717-1 [Araneus ventricosus]